MRNLWYPSNRFIHNKQLLSRDEFTRLLLLLFCFWRNCKHLYLSGQVLKIFLHFEVIFLHATFLFLPFEHQLLHLYNLRYDRNLSSNLLIWLDPMKEVKLLHLFHSGEHNRLQSILLSFRWQKVNLFLDKNKITYKSSS